MTRRALRSLGASAALVALAVAGCTDDGADTVDGTVDETVEETIDGTAEPSGEAAVATPADGSLFPAGDVDDGLRPWIDSSTAELAEALGVDAGAVTTVSAVLVVWPDASLGCPEPDELYASVETDGAIIELAAGGAVYRFHAGGDTEPFLCERPISEAPRRL